ncbi:MAG: glycine cleavage system aminomethyltransferase GcvT [Verrucomicrobiales bacterium]|nr:glycine cleavage system aminomethyltransferase GcvT [Verrucomicrobiales bacterium]MCP5526578.1 glycine cleavage system aminomethyltransferase GcvT [Verrucomicrobiales bacterium]
MLKHTPLHAAHGRLGARLTGFGGWEMPLQYAGIVEEHLAVRRAAGVFDISHMGNFTVTGPGAAAYLDFCLTNDVNRLAIGQGQYTLLCHEAGGVIDDLYLFRVKPEEFALVVNAARTSDDWDWLQTQVDRAPTRDGFHLRDDSSRFAAVAVQGPRVRGFMEEVIQGGSIAGMLVSTVLDLRRNQWGTFVFQGGPAGVARTGYTGEDGFEIIIGAEQAEALLEALLDRGGPHGLQPAGLGARDTLRTEMGYPLYGHELDESISPLEAGLGTFVALDKRAFIGAEALREQQARGIGRRSIALRMIGKTPTPRPGYPVFVPGADDTPVGRLSSGTSSPSLGCGIGLALVPVAHRAVGTRLNVGIRNRLYPAEVVAKPLYRRPASPG